MMCALSLDTNRDKLKTVGSLLDAELGVKPRAFRAGRWAMGPTVAPNLEELGYNIDCSVTPFIDWSHLGGPDYSFAPNRPYRFDASDPLTPTARGSLWQIPMTIGFLRGEHRRAGRLRTRLGRSFYAKFKLVGALDRLGILARRWLSPETSSASTMIRLAESTVRSGGRVLLLTFHSSALLPGATPFVRTLAERDAFLADTESFLRHCREAGYAFRTLSETSQELMRFA
jgi:hypothetical protein